MSTESLQRAFASTGAVVGRVGVGDLDKPTPCASWTVRDLLDHTFSVPGHFAAALTGKPAGDPPDFATADLVARYAEVSGACVAAFDAPGAMDKVLKLPFGDMPGAMAVQIAATDAFVHGWDLAKATGQSTDLDPELAAQMLVAVQRAVGDDRRGPDGQAPFGPRVELAEPGTAADELAAFMGRHP